MYHVLTRDQTLHQRLFVSGQSCAFMLKSLPVLLHANFSLVKFSKLPLCMRFHLASTKTCLMCCLSFRHEGLLFLNQIDCLCLQSNGFFSIARLLFFVVASTIQKMPLSVLRLEQKLLTLLFPTAPFPLMFLTPHGIDLLRHPSCSLLHFFGHVVFRLPVAPLICSQFMYGLLSFCD